MNTNEKPLVININLDTKCKRCGKGGATDNGVCLPCINKALKNGEFDHILKPLKNKVRRYLRK